MWFFQNDCQRVQDQFFEFGVREMRINGPEASKPMRPLNAEDVSPMLHAASQP